MLITWLNNALANGILYWNQYDYLYHLIAYIFVLSLCVFICIPTYYVHSIIFHYLPPSFHSSMHPSSHPSVHQCLHLFIHLSVYIGAFIHPLTLPVIYVYIYSSIYLSVSAHSSIHSPFL